MASSTTVRDPSRAEGVRPAPPLGAGGAGGRSALVRNACACLGRRRHGRRRDSRRAGLRRGVELGRPGGRRCFGSWFAQKGTRFAFITDTTRRSSGSAPRALRRLTMKL